MATFYLKSGSGVTQFAQSTAYVAGDRIVPVRSDAGSNYLVARRWVWECTTPGTTAAANPTWPASVTQDVTTVTSGTATFTARKPGFSSGTTAAWTFATIFLDYIHTAFTSAGDILYVSNNHAESVAASISINTVISGASIICVDDSSAPPTAAATTATVTTTGASSITLGGTARFYYIYGITFTAGNGGNLDIQYGLHESCNYVTGTSGVNTLFTGVTMINPGFKFGNASSAVVGSSGISKIYGATLLSGGTSPTNFLNSAGAAFFVDGLDLSNGAAGINVCSNTASLVSVRNAKLPASWSGAVNSGTESGHLVEAVLMNVDNTGTNYVLRGESRWGSTVSETTVVKSGGFSVVSTPVSWKLVSTSGCGPAGCYVQAHSTPEIAAYNSTTGSAITVTVDFIHDSATAMQDNEIFLEVTYLGAAGSPLGTYVSSRPATPMTAASDLAASSATWTTTGLTNPNAQKMSVTFTPQLAGMVIGRVKLCKASKTVYVDPALQLS